MEESETMYLPKVFKSLNKHWSSFSCPWSGFGYCMVNVNYSEKKEWYIYSVISYMF